MEFNKYNHNECGNPHPQYNLPIYVSQSTGSNNVSYVQVFDLLFKNENSTNWKNLQRLFFSAYVYNLTSDISEQKIGFFNFYFKLNSDQTYNCNMKFIPLVDGNKFEDKEYFKCYITKNPSTYSVKLFAKIYGQYEKIRIKPIIYDTTTNPVDWENPSRNSNLSIYQQMEFIFDNFSNRPLLQESELPTNVTAIVTDNTSLKQDSTSSVSVLDAYNTKYFYLNKPTDSYISEIINGSNLQEINLIAFNSNTTIRNNEKIKLKSDTDTKIPYRGILKLRLVTGVWWEESRSF